MSLRRCYVVRVMLEILLDAAQLVLLLGIWMRLGGLTVALGELRDGQIQQGH